MNEFQNFNNQTSTFNLIFRKFIPSLIFFLRPKVPKYSKNDSSFFFCGVAGLGDFGRGEAMFTKLQ